MFSLWYENIKELFTFYLAKKITSNSESEVKKNGVRSRIKDLASFKRSRLKRGNKVGGNKWGKSGSDGTRFSSHLMAHLSRHKKSLRITSSVTIKYPVYQYEEERLSCTDLRLSYLDFHRTKHNSYRVLCTS